MRLRPPPRTKRLVEPRPPLPDPLPRGEREPEVTTMQQVTVISGVLGLMPVGRGRGQRRNLRRIGGVSVCDRGLALGDLDLGALAQFQRGWLLEGDPHRQDAGVGEAAGVFGADAAGDEGIGDLFDGAGPGAAGVAGGGDGGGAALWQRGMSYSSISASIRRRFRSTMLEQGRAQDDGLAGVRPSRETTTPSIGGPNAGAGEFGLDPR